MTIKTMILPRYILKEYLRIFLLSLSTFILLLIVSRFKEIARFGALSNSFSKVILFVSYQIPYILPLAIPISSLLAAFLLFRKMSTSNELLALRTSSISLFSLITPLLYLMGILTLLHFTISSEIAPHFGRCAKKILYHETSGNPLLLLQRQNLIKMKDAYISMRDKKSYYEDFLLITHNPKLKRLSLFQGDELRVLDNQLVGDNLSFLIHFPTPLGSFDTLFLENQKKLWADASLLSVALKKHRPKIELNQLNMKMLLIRSLQKDKYAKGAKIEILRRISLTLILFPLTMLGLVFAIDQRRIPTVFSIWILFAFLIFFLSVYLSLPALKKAFIPALFLAFSPHALMLIFTMKRFQKISGGKV